GDDLVTGVQTCALPISAQLATDEAALAEHRTLLSQRGSRASSIREEIATLTGDVERLRSFLQQSEASLADLRTRIEIARGQTTNIGNEAAEQQTRFDEKTVDVEHARAERNRLREIADQLERDRQDKSDQVRGHDSALADARQ